MALLLPAPPPSRSRPASLPLPWREQQRLLSAQHDRLEALLAELLTSPAADLAPLRRQLRLHLRLEERWLERRGCLCPGHRASHRQALAELEAGIGRAAADGRARLALLRGLQAWFLAHRDGPDAIAYARAAGPQR